MRTVIIPWLLCYGILNAQLVEKPVPATTPSSTKKQEGGKIPASGHVPAKVAVKDMLEKRRFPKHFQGYLLTKKDDKVGFLFDGNWKKAPEINGGDKTAEWSNQAAFLHDLDQPGGSKYYLISFNLGMKNGRWLARLFKWEKDPDLGGSSKAVPVMDEGTGELKDGTFTFDMDSYRIVLRSGDKNWEAKEVLLGRFCGTELSTEARPKPSFAGRTSDVSAQWPSQYAPVWTSGIYLILEDDTMGKVLYRPFGDSTQTWVTRFVKNEGKKLFEGTRYYAGTSLKDHAGIEFAGLYMNGMANFESAVSAAGKANVQFKISQDLKIEEIRYSGAVEDVVFGNATLNCTLFGESSWVDLPGDYKSELLNRVKDTSWIGSGGPYGLSRMFKRAFEGYSAQSPMLSQTIINMPDKSISKDISKMWNDKTQKAWENRSRSWAQFIFENGIDVQMTPVRTKLYPMGVLLLKNSHKTENQNNRMIPQPSGEPPEGMGEAVLVINNDTPVYSDSTGKIIRIKLNKGSAGGAFNQKGFEKSKPILYSENGRYRIWYLNSDDEKSISGHIGWIEQNAVTIFYYSCSGDFANRCRPIIDNGIFVKYSQSFLDARRQKIEELNIKP